MFVSPELESRLVSRQSLANDTNTSLNSTSELNPVDLSKMDVSSDFQVSPVFSSPSFVTQGDGSHINEAAGERVSFSIRSTHVYRDERSGDESDVCSTRNGRS